MPTVKAGYYTDELINWNESIIFYSQEIAALEQKLIEVLRRNSIIGIASKVETQQAALDRLHDKFHRLDVAIRQQETILKADHSLVDDTLINSETEKQQAELRHEIQSVEKGFIDAKYNCYNFLAGTLKK